ncbi:MAG: MFS transporter [Candidatus Paceibacterota bacterium]
MNRKIIRQYYILSCLFDAGGMAIISAIYVAFLINNGLNLFETNMVNVAFFLTLFVCEIPTGAFADIFGRKTSFVLACGLMCVSMFIYGYSRTFWGFVIAEVVAAIGSTFKSGAFQAWMVDSLKHHGYEGSCTQIFARERLIRQIGGGIGAVTGSYLMAVDQSLPWFFGASILGITTIVAWTTMEEEYFVKTAFSWGKGWASMKSVAVSSIHYGMDHKAVRFVLIITAIQIFAVQALNMYWQPFFKDHGLKDKHLGFMFVAMMCMLAIGAFIASKLNSQENERRIIIRTQIMVGIIIVAAALVPGLPFIAVLFLLHEVPRGCWSPMIDGYLQHRIPSYERATITSFCSIAPHIGGVVGLIVSGVIAQFYGIATAWIFSGIVLVGGALLVARNGGSNNPK